MDLKSLTLQDFDLDIVRGTAAVVTNRGQTRLYFQEAAIRLESHISNNSNLIDIIGLLKSTMIDL